MSKAPYMPLYVDAYLGDTMHLTTEEHGAYLLLLMSMWRRNGAVPDDDRDNARITGLTPRKWRAFKARMGPILTFENDEITQKRLKKEWEFVENFREKQRRNGRKGGRPKSKENNDLAKATGSVWDNPNESPHPIPNQIEELEPIGSCQPSSERLPVQKAFENYKLMASDLGLPIPRGLDEARKRHLRARLREHGIEGWNEMLYRLAESEHCLGKNDRGWRASFDWLCKPTNFNKVLDGNYVRQEVAP